MKITITPEAACELSNHINTLLDSATNHQIFSIEIKNPTDKDLTDEIDVFVNFQSFNIVGGR